MLPRPDQTDPEPGLPPAVPPVVRWSPQPPSWVAFKLLVLFLGLGFIVAADHYRAETAANRTATLVITARPPANGTPARLPAVTLAYADRRDGKTRPAQPVLGLEDRSLAQSELSVPLPGLNAILVQTSGRPEIVRLYGPENENFLRLEIAAMHQGTDLPPRPADDLAIMVQPAADGSAGAAWMFLPRPTVTAGPAAAPFLIGWTLAYAAVFAVVGGLVRRLWRFQRDRAAAKAALSAAPASSSPSSAAEAAPAEPPPRR